MKVIFLDIDGVLNTESYRENPNVDYFENPISETHMPLLEYLVKKTDAKIVLSSTWREYWDASEIQSDRFGDYINNLFRKYNLDIYDKTPELRNRDEEITEWKKRYQSEIESFVIVDDFDFEWSEPNINHIVKTIDDIGLDEEAVERAMQILKRDDGSI